MTARIRELRAIPGRRSLCAIAVVLVCVGCAAPAVSESQGQPPSAAGTSFVSSTPAPTPAPTTFESQCPDPDAQYPHQDPALEAVLPDSVADRHLTSWSLTGRCWPEFVGLDPATIPSSFGKEVALDDLAYAIAGRSADGDPPYFVHVTRHLTDPDADAVAARLLLGVAGFIDLENLNPEDFTEMSISGKDVEVGTLAMLSQDAHQRGRPYYYEAEDYSFLIVTDDEQWAADALSQLP